MIPLYGVTFVANQGDLELDVDEPAENPYDALASLLGKINLLIAESVFERRRKKLVDTASSQAESALSRFPKLGILIRFAQWKSVAEDLHHRDMSFDLSNPAPNPETAFVWLKRRGYLLPDYGPGWRLEFVYMWATNRVEISRQVKVLNNACYVDESFFKANSK